MAHAEQANKHDEKQDYVGCRQGNEGESVTQRRLPYTGQGGREVIVVHAVLRDGVREWI